MLDLEQARAAACSIAEATLGVAAGPMNQVASKSHLVFVNSAVVVKIIDASGHSRLDREIALALDLPAGLSSPVLASGRYPMEAGEVRYACVARLPGTAPGMGLAGVDRASALRWARQAVRQLQRLHDWIPAASAAATLRESPEHGGFVGRAQLQHELDRVRDLDRQALVPSQLTDGLSGIAERAPEHAEANIAVHADCHWGNWLVHDQSVTALLDFEWARFGEPADDWMFLSRFSGPHMQPVLSLIAELTTTPPEKLRAECEVREAAHLTSDLRLALQQDRDQDRGVNENIHRTIRELRKVVTERSWWQPESGLR